MFKNNRRKSKKILNKFLILSSLITILNTPIIEAMPNNNFDNVDKTKKAIRIIKNKKFEKIPENLKKLNNKENKKNKIKKNPK